VGVEALLCDLWRISDFCSTGKAFPVAMHPTRTAQQRIASTADHAKVMVANLLRHCTILPAVIYGSDAETSHTKQVTVAILLNGFLGAIAAAEEEAAEAAAAGMKSKEMLRYHSTIVCDLSGRGGGD
jgi:hypothetical protein